jgi:hypothetical protein
LTDTTEHLAVQTFRMTPTLVPRSSAPRPEIRHGAERPEPRKCRSLEWFPCATSAEHGNKSRDKDRDNAGNNSTGGRGGVGAEVWAFVPSLRIQ